MASYRRDVGPMNKTFDTTTGGDATVENLGMVDKETRQKRLLETQPGGAAESVDTVFPEVEAAVAASTEAKAAAETDAVDAEVEAEADAEVEAAAEEEQAEEPAAEEGDGLPEGALDTIKDAKAYVDGAEGEERKARAEAVLAAETEGEARVTLVDWLEDVLAEG